ncbi:unnamed protein product [Chrysoparadoxa australica]
MNKLKPSGGGKHLSSTRKKEEGSKQITARAPPSDGIDLGAGLAKLKAATEEEIAKEEELAKYEAEKEEWLYGLYEADRKTLKHWNSSCSNSNSNSNSNSSTQEEKAGSDQVHDSSSSAAASSCSWSSQPRSSLAAQGSASTGRSYPATWQSGGVTQGKLYADNFGKLQDAAKLRQYAANWIRFRERKTQPIRHCDIPWPPTMRKLPCGAEKFDIIGVHENANKDVKKAALRHALLRWHPDKFMVAYGGRFSPGHEESIKKDLKLTWLRISKLRDRFYEQQGENQCSEEELRSRLANSFPSTCSTSAGKLQFLI